MEQLQFQKAESRNGLPIIEAIVDGNPLLLHSKYDPEKEAVRLIESYKDKIEKADHILFYGAGMGYHIKAFFEQYPEKLASVYEPFEEIAKLTIEHQNVLKVPLTLLQQYVVRTEEQLSLYTLSAFDRNLNQSFEIIVLPGYGKWQDDRLKEFYELFKQLMETKKGNTNSSLAFSRRWTLNALMNLPKTMEHPNFLIEKKAYFKGKPIIIVSAGPSLSEEFENLRMIKEKGLAYIFAVGSANKALIKENIYPDAVCTYDPQNHNYTVFSEMIEKNIDTIPMIYGTTVGFETIDYYKGPKLYFPVSQDRLIEHFHKDPMMIVDDASTIAIVTLQLLNVLEVSKVILVGQNFAFKNNQYYANGIKRHDEKNTAKEDNVAAEKDLENTFEIEDVFGGKVLTNQTFKQQRDNMEAYLSIMKMPIVNTTIGGAAIKGTTFKRLAELMLNELTESVVVENWWQPSTAKREVLNTAFLSKYRKELDQFELQLDELQNYLMEWYEQLPKLDDKQIQQNFEKFDNLFQKFHRNAFYKTTILPIAQIPFEKLKNENDLILAMTDVRSKSKKITKAYTNYIQQCQKIYVDIIPIVCNYTLPKLNALSGQKIYEATSGVFHYEGEWNKKFPPEKEKMPEDLTEEEQEEWYKQKKLEDKIDLSVPIYVETTQKGATIRFQVKGKNLALYGINASDEVLKLSITLDKQKKIVTINGNEKNEYIRKSIFSASNLKYKMHEVTIEVLSDNPHLLFDGIELDSASRAYHIDEVERVEELEIGKRIRCHYEATYNTVGEFSGLGNETGLFLPVEATPEPNGDFYFIMVDAVDGEKKLIADRDIQNYISWETLNNYGLGNTATSKLIESLGNNIYMSLLTGGTNEDDRNNDWNQYIIESNLNNTIQPNNDFIWNWSSKSGTWTNTILLHNNPNGVLMKPVRGKLFANDVWHGEDALRWVWGTTTNIGSIISFRIKMIIEHT